MDKNVAWNNFLKSGGVDDYLEFCKYKNMEDNKLGQKLESEWNSNSGK